MRRGGAAAEGGRGARLGRRERHRGTATSRRGRWCGKAAAPAGDGGWRGGDSEELDTGARQGAYTSAIRTVAQGSAATATSVARRDGCAGVSTAAGASGTRGEGPGLCEVRRRCPQRVTIHDGSGLDRHICIIFTSCPRRLSLRSSRSSRPGRRPSRARTPIRIRSRRPPAARWASRRRPRPVRRASTRSPRWSATPYSPSRATPTPSRPRTPSSVRRPRGAAAPDGRFCGPRSARWWRRPRGRPASS